MISLETIYADLSALSDSELEKVQLAVNSEVAVRIQNERLARRIEKAVTEAQSVGFNDAEISTIIDDATSKARKGKREEDDTPLARPKTDDPALIGPVVPGTKKVIK